MSKRFQDFNEEKKYIMALEKELNRLAAEKAKMDDNSQIINTKIESLKGELTQAINDKEFIQRYLHAKKDNINLAASYSFAGAIGILIMLMIMFLLLNVSIDVLVNLLTKLSIILGVSATFVCSFISLILISKDELRFNEIVNAFALEIKPKNSEELCKELVTGLKSQIVTIQLDLIKSISEQETISQNQKIIGRKINYTKNIFDTVTAQLAIDREELWDSFLATCGEDLDEFLMARQPIKETEKRSGKILYYSQYVERKNV